MWNLCEVIIVSTKFEQFGKNVSEAYVLVT